MNATRAADWQRPPFEPGNTLAVTHGAGSDALVRPEAEALLPAILDCNPHLDPLRDGFALQRLTMTLARIARVYRWLDGQGDAVFSDVDEGTAHGVFERLERWERAADQAEERLAISPLTRARLGLDQLRAAVLTEDELQARRAARERLDARLAELKGEDDD